MAYTRQPTASTSTRSTRLSNQAGPANGKRRADTADSGRSKKKAKTTGQAPVQMVPSSARGKAKGTISYFPTFISPQRMTDSHSTAATTGRKSKVTGEDPVNSDDEYVSLFGDDEQGGGTDDEREEDIDHDLVVSPN